MYDPFVRNSSAAGGLSSVSTYRHCAVIAVGNDSTARLQELHPPAEATADNGNFSR